MLRLRFLFKNLSRSYSVFTPQRSAEKAIIDMKFSNSKSLEAFLDSIDVSKTSLPMLSYTLKIAKDLPQKFQLEASKKLLEIRNEVILNLDKLDFQSIVDFSDWCANSNVWSYITSLRIEKKKILVSRINELIRRKSFDRKQILSIYENLAPQGIKIEALENEIEKIADSPLTLEEISQIFIGFGDLIYTSKRKWFCVCMDKIFELNQEKLDTKYLAKILDTLSGKSNVFLIDYLSEFVKLIEYTLPRWKENELLSIIKFYKKSNGVSFKMYYCALEQFKNLLDNYQPVEILAELISLLKEDIKYNPIIDKIVSKSSMMIKEKLSCESIDFKNLKIILDVMKPILDYQTALKLADRINSCRFLVLESLELLQKASWICVNKEGKLFPLTDLLSERMNDSKIKDMKIRIKINILINIALTKNYKQNGLHEIKEFLIEDIKKFITEKDDNFRLFIALLYDREYNSRLFKALKPLQNVIFDSTTRLFNNHRSLFFSMMFYESDPEKWEDFVIENKNNFSDEAVLKAIRYYQGPFEAIIFLLKTFQKKLSVLWIGAAMQRIYGVQDVQILNDFARILNRMDSYYLLNDNLIYTQAEVFMYLFDNSDCNLLKNLFADACNRLKDLSLDAIFSKNHIKMLSCASLLGVLEPELADLVFSDYGYMNKSDLLSMLAISSKCTDSKLREKIIKQVLNEDLDLKKFTSLLYRYWYHPETKEIDNYIIDLLKKVVRSSGLNSIPCLISTINKLSKLNVNNHLELYNTLITLTKDLILYNTPRLRFPLLYDLLNLAHKNLLVDLDFAYVIQNCQKGSNNENSREKLIEKIKTVGLSDKNAVLAVCNKQDRFSSAYLAETISCLAELRFEKENWANEMANKLIYYAEDQQIVFENNAEYINWIYGLVTFQANKSVIMRHIENSKYLEFKLPTFKHLLLENHFRAHPDYKGVEFLKQNALQYLHDIDYFEHFGIDKPLISIIESLFNKANLEVKAGAFLDGIWIPFYIPNANAALWPVTNSILLYRSKILRGEFYMHKNQMHGKLKNLHILNKTEINEIEKRGIKQFLNI